MIKFDLHIHSDASKYKESSNIVDDSTIENVNVILDKLNEHNVTLFSITDHNRFNVDLYHEIDRILMETDCPYKNVKTVLPGVEFDVKIDGSMGKCHIITIFETDNKNEKYQKINAAINKDRIETEERYYSKEEFEDILYDIGLNTILIACQRKDINNHSGHHNSLSDSSNEVEKILKVGYINALEYQKPKVEGILKNNLKELPLPVSLVTGSDCHTWSCYPDHDNINKNPDFYHSQAKILPTFKGLLMAITSPETRFDSRENTNINLYKGIKINGKEISFVNGINAIIGENGSGKSTLLKLINDQTSESHVKQIVKNNALELINTIDRTKVKYIKQGDIIERFNKNTLFSSDSEDNFKSLDNSEFISKYTKFAEALKKQIYHNITAKSSIDSMKNCEIEYNSSFETKNYYIDAICPEGFDTIENIHDTPLKKVKKLLIDLRELKNKPYFNGYKKQLTIADSQLYEIYENIHKNWVLINAESLVKNTIQSGISSYKLKINENSSSRDKDKKDYTDKKQNLVDAVCRAIKLIYSSIEGAIPPKAMSGVSKNAIKGFYFNRVASYNNVDVLDVFLNQMLNKDFQDLNKLKEINSNKTLVEAIKGCSSEVDIKKIWSSNFEKFIAACTKYNEFITDSSNQKVGNTLGEMSISFYKYYAQKNDEWSVLIIDQPEDNISNNNISKELIKYFNSLRDKKQLIFVTHNPLLVVNLDVDNVIYLHKESDDLSIQSGCLEYEDDSINIIDVIAKNMDGGKETIEKRMKVYGKGN